MLLEHWLRDMEKIFTTNGTLEIQKIDQATFYLREDGNILLRLLLEVDSFLSILGDKSAVNLIG